MNRIILTKTGQTQGFALLKKKDKFWLVTINYSKFRKEKYVESSTIIEVGRINTPEKLKFAKTLIRNFNSSIKGLPMQVIGKGVRANKTAIWEVVCVNPDIYRSISLNLKYVADLETLLNDYVKDWVYEAK